MAKKSAAEKKVIQTRVDQSMNMYEDMYKSINGIVDKKKQLEAIQESYAYRQKLINEMEKDFANLTEDQQRFLQQLVNTQNEVYNNLKKATAEQEAYNKRIAEGEKRYNKISEAVQKLWGFLNDNDKIIRQTILNLGMSGAKAELVRSSFEQSALYAAKLGGGLEDVQMIMQGFADETGRAVALSDEMVKATLAIGRGTGLGVEQATKLAAQFEFMGVDAKSTMDYVQGVVDTSERMGVNTTKVLKTVTDNFKKLSTFTFQGGVKAFGQMAMDAEKTRVSMATALDVAEATRGLEQVIELGANLQVMGGRFAEMDPFQWLYMARNEPDKMNEKISEMTKGIYTFKKNSEGLFEKAISPADRDRLANVAKSLGISKEEMFEIAQRRLDLDTMDKQLGAAGLTKKQKELIQGAAKFDTKSGKFQVMLAGTMQDISSLTKDQAESFVKEQSLLEERAKQAQTFDEAFKATINELKSVLLPMLGGVKKVLDFVRPIAEKFTKFVDWMGKGGIGPTLLKFGGMIMAGSFLLIKAFSLFGGLVGNLKNIIPILGVGFGKATSTLGGGGGNAAQMLAGGKASKAAGIGAGARGLGVGAGIGAAMAGAGAGIMLAAKGLSQLAEAMKGMTDEQAKALKSIGMTLAITFPLAAVGILLAGKAAEVSAVGLLVLGGALLMVGAGIGLATAGIGYMAKGIAEMNKSGTGAGKQLKDVAVGVGAITYIMLGGGGIAAMFAFNNSLSRMAKNSGGIERIGTAFASIQAVLSGTKEDFIAVENAIASIGKANVKGGGLFTELSSLLKQPLKVEFADKRVAMVSNITLDINGEKFTEKVIKYDALVENSERTRGGLRGS